MKISIIIPTYKRVSYLEKIVKSLLKESVYINEIIVVNTGNADITFKNNLIKVIKSNNLIIGKNVALKQIRSKWVLILDDDLVLNTNTISKFISASLKYKFDGASGIITQELNYKNVFLKYCKYGRQTFFKTPSLNFNIKDIKPYKASFLPGGFLFCKKSVFEKVGFYDSKYLLPFFNEDTDITVRMVKSGFNLMIIPKIKVVHLKAQTGGVRRLKQENKWFYAFGFNNSYFYIKNYSLFIYLLYCLFNVRDHLFVMKKLKFDLYYNYLKGIYYGYKTSSKFFNS